MIKNIKIVQKQFLIAQKKRLDALNATEKTPALNKVLFLVIWGGQKVTRHGKKDTKKISIFFLIRMQNGTRKWVVEVLLSHVVLLGHSSVQGEEVN